MGQGFDSTRAEPAGVAIVGLGGCFPDAPNVATLWKNICANHVAIGEVPADRWPRSRHFSADRQASDKTYSSLGGFVRTFDFDPRRFRIPPRVLEAIDPLQQMTLTAVHEALCDAGLQAMPGAGEGRPFDRERCAVILGNSMGGEMEDRTSLRVWLDEGCDALRETLRGRVAAAEVEELVDAFAQRWRAQLPAITEDTMTGEISNCVSGRVCNAFDLCGPNFTTDAACAASMAAVETGVLGLRQGRFDLAIVGGADRSMDPPTYVKFSKIGALSARGSTPFDARADGFVMGEGVGILVMCRLQDALAAGARIYGVIAGIGAASDGRGRGITAPNPRGQRLAMERAWGEAGCSIASAGFFEAHGTSTIVGDQTEVEVLSELLAAAGEPRKIPIGSIKSMIGHTKSAAGAAALIKASLALAHRTLPPSASFLRPPADSPLHRGYLDVCTATRAWPAGPLPRRVGVSSFGFGGTNFHVVLQEAPTGGAPILQAVEPAVTQKPAAVRERQVARGIADEVVALVAEQTGYPASDLALDLHMEADLGIDTVKQAEVLGVLRQRYPSLAATEVALADVPTLRSLIDTLARAIPEGPRPPAASAGAPAEPANAPAAPHLVAGGGATIDEARAAAARQVAAGWPPPSAAAWEVVRGAQPARLALWARSPAQAAAKLAEVGRARPALLAAQGVHLHEPAAPPPGQTAFLFPGQGSQYLGMLQDLAGESPVVAETFAVADRVMAKWVGRPLTEVVWPAHHDEHAEGALRRTEMCQPAMLTADVAMMRLLAEHGIRPDWVVGHSLGEYAALVAAGVLAFEDALVAVSARGREMAEVDVPDCGKMAMVATDLSTCEAQLALVQGYVIAANHNCRTQTVIAGESAAVDAAVARFGAAGFEARTLPVSHAFHCRIVAPAAQPLMRVLGGLSLRAPMVPILSNVKAQRYPSEPAQIVQLLGEQLASPVAFIAQIEALWRAGVRQFIEVGPRRAITGFVRSILADRPHHALPSNHHRRPGAEGVADLLAALAAIGVAPHAAPPAPARARGRAAARSRAAALREVADDAVVISGLAAALPGPTPVGPVDADTVGRLLAGDNLIGALSPGEREAIVGHRVTRLDKAGGRLMPVTSAQDVIAHAGRMAPLDLAASYGLDPQVVAALDATGRLALAVGIDALRDAGVPQVGRRPGDGVRGPALASAWALPPAWRPRCGVILAAAFPGADQMLADAARRAEVQACEAAAEALESFAATCDDASAHRARAEAGRRRLAAGVHDFDRRWLFRTLALGHAQLAQLLGARGANTQINAACASGTQALVIAHDWLRLGRCDQVLVVSADNVTHPASLPWFAAGFLAAGAASVEPDLERAATPFGAHRNGMILGAGAAGFVVERMAAVRARGMVPVAEVVGTELGNSAFHGTRLDVGFIQERMRSLVASLTDRFGGDAADLARRLVFMSHETYTPARGGSAAAEVEALRHAFGTAASEVLIANTKGHVGHPMGASLEDAVVLRGLQHRRLPPVANLREVDPQFADLKFARGGGHDADFAIRLAAGFGSQLALIAYRGLATGAARVADENRYLAWVRAESGLADGGLRVEHRHLRAVAGGLRPSETGVPSLAVIDAPVPAAADADVAVAAASPPPPVPAPVDRLRPQPEPVPSSAALEAEAGPLRARIVAAFAAATGYPACDLAGNQRLEADLGIDTVKQAEVLGQLRAELGVAHEQAAVLAELDTIDAIVAWLQRQAGAASAGPVPAAPSLASVAPPAAAAGQPKTGVGAGRVDEAIAAVTDLFAEHTGYGHDELAPDSHLEADLGIDTVKQAEVLGILRQRFAIDEARPLALSDTPTIAAIARVLVSAPLPPPGSADGAAGGPAPSSPVPATAPVAAARGAAGDAAAADAANEAERARAAACGAGFQVRGLELAPGPASGPGDLAGARVAFVGDFGPVRDALAAAALRAGAEVVQLPPLPSPQQASDQAWALAACRVQLVVGCLPPAAQDGGGLQASVGCAFATLQAFARYRGAQADLPQLVLVGQGAAAAAAAAMAKSVVAEHPALRLRAAIWPEGAIDPQLAARTLAMADGGGPIEMVAAGDGWGRWQAGAPATWQARPLAAGSHVVATGAARGITYRLLAELCRAAPLHLWLLARTGPAEGDALVAARADDSERREAARAALAAAGQAVTPLAVRRWLERQRATVEVADNLAALRALGSTVHLMRCDVGDPAQLQEALARLPEAARRPALLLHGAGVEHSRMFADKDAATLAATMAPKALAAAALVARLRPRRVVTMGSIAGVWGNAGQADYAAANAYLGGRARGQQSWLNIGWTAWRDEGMASRGSVPLVLAQRGVAMLPSALGVPLGAQLIASDLVGEVVVAGAMGSQAAAGDVEGGRLRVSREEVAAGAAPTVARTFDPRRDHGLGDHRIDGTAVLPGVMGLEVMAAATLEICGWAPACLENVVFRRPVKFHDDRPRVVRVVVREEADGAQLELTTSPAPGQPPLPPALAVHFSAWAPRREPPRPVFAPSDLGNGAWPPGTPSRTDVYRRYFHGPSFQVIDEVRGVASGGVDVAMARRRGRWLPEVSDCGWQVPGIQLEAGFQAVGLWEMAQMQRVSLPAAIARVWCRPAAAAAIVRARVAVHHDGEPTPRFDLIAEEAGVHRVLAEGYLGVLRRPMRADERFSAPAVAATAVAAASSRLLMPLDEVVPILERLPASAHDVLSDEESAHLAGLPREKRRLDWLGARVAAKRLLAQAGLAGPGGARTLTITKDELGAPWVRPAGGGPQSPVHLSLAHGAGLAAALLSQRPEVRCGIDVEAVADRHPGFAAAHFLPSEQAAASRDRHPAAWLTAAWAAKEAVLKALGIGARVDFRQLEVDERRDGWRVTLHGRAAARAERLGVEAIHMEVIRDDQRVIAVATVPVRATIAEARA